MKNNKDKKTIRPIKALNNFLRAWQNDNFEQMIEYSQLTWREVKDDSVASFLQDIFLSNRLCSWKIENTKMISGVCADITVELNIHNSINGGTNTKKVIARIICESKPFHTDIKGIFGVNPSTVLRGMFDTNKSTENIIGAVQ